jgi:vacuolar protein sorting-associated protein 45
VYLPIQGVDNVYTQHSPHLAQTLDQLIRGRLKDSTYPYLDNQPTAGQMQGAQQKPQDVVLFMIGGTTYEEARTVAMINSQGSTAPPGATTGASSLQANTRVVLAGTGVLSSKTFLAMLRDAAFRFPATMTSSALSLKPTSNPAAPVNLKLGGMELSLSNVGRTPSGLESGVKDAARGLFETIKQGVERF